MNQPKSEYRRLVANCPSFIDIPEIMMGYIIELGQELKLIAHRISKERRYLQKTHYKLVRISHTLEHP